MGIKRIFNSQSFIMKIKLDHTLKAFKRVPVIVFNNVNYTIIIAIVHMIVSMNQNLLNHLLLRTRAIHVLFLSASFLTSLPVPSTVPGP